MIDELQHSHHQLQLSVLHNRTYDIVGFAEFKVGWTNLARLAARDIAHVEKGRFSAYRTPNGELKVVCSVYPKMHCLPAEYVFSEIEQKWMQICSAL